jgi:hypothetical protein
VASRIAPRLSAFILAPGNAFAAEGWSAHRAELRALLAVARAARGVAKRDAPLFRALARLDKVSGAK